MGGETTLLPAELLELELDSSARLTGSPVGRVTLAANVTSSPLRSGGGHSATSPRPRTPVFSLEDALRSNRQVCVSLDEEEFTAVIIDEPITPRTPRSAPARPQSARLVTDCGVTSEIGRRAENQDGWILSDRFAGHDGVVFAAVLDGHGTDGRLVSQFVQDTLPDRLAAQPDLLTDPPAALVRAFSETQAALLDPESTLQTDFSGATATCILIVKRRLHVAKCAPLRGGGARGRFGRGRTVSRRARGQTDRCDRQMRQTGWLTARARQHARRQSRARRPRRCLRHRLLPPRGARPAL